MSNLVPLMTSDLRSVSGPFGEATVPQPFVPSATTGNDTARPGEPPSARVPTGGENETMETGSSDRGAEASIAGAPRIAFCGSLGFSII